jgi:hypothetical protein
VYHGWPRGASAGASWLRSVPNLAHGLGHGPVGALVSAWPALALVGSFELLMLLIRTQHHDGADSSTDAEPSHSAPVLARREPPVVPPAPSLEQTVRDWHGVGHSQRAIARELNIDRRKVKQIIEHAA